MAFIDTVRSLPLSSKELVHKRKTATRSLEACALKILPLGSRLRYQFVQTKAPPYLLVLSCSSSLPTENISRFIFHFLSSPHRKFLCAHGCWIKGEYLAVTFVSLPMHNCTTNGVTLDLEQSDLLKSKYQQMPMKSPFVEATLAPLLTQTMEAKKGRREKIASWMIYSCSFFFLIQCRDHLSARDQVDGIYCRKQYCVCEW